MPDGSLERRVDFCIQLLKELKNLTEEAIQEFYQIERLSRDLYDRLFIDERDQIQKEIDRYQENLYRVTQLNEEIIEVINSWYSFSKDPGEIKQFLYPVRFWKKKKECRKRIQNIKQEIDRITVENRFIKEKIALWERDVGQKSLQLIKQDEHYQKYLQMIERKADLMSDVKYLLETLPLGSPVKLDIKDIDSFVESLSAVSKFNQKKTTS